MIYVGIDVASSKHDCCILNSDGIVLIENFQFSNNLEGFYLLYNTILSHLPSENLSEIRIGLESTGHYSSNLVSFLSSKQLELVVFNPLSVNLFRKAYTLRKTKTDKTDARFIAVMLFSSNSKSYIPASYHISELKSLTRHRFRLINHRSKLKVSVTRLVTIVFPELLTAFSSLHQKSVYELLLELPNSKDVSECHLTKLTNLLCKHSHGRYNREKALQLRNLASNSIGSNSLAAAFELRQTIRLINNINDEIDLLDKQIKSTMLELNSPILSIPGISYILGAIILSEIGDIVRFDNPSKLLAFAGLEPSTYQSGNFTAGKTPMVKRGSTYLRWALLNAARLISMRDNTFKQYYQKKKSEGKHHFTAISHVGKKLIRVIFHLLKNNCSFVPQY